MNNKVKILIGVLAVAGLIAGGWFLLNQQADASVMARVNGEEITAEEVAQVQEIFGQQGEQISEEDALEQLINQKLIAQESKNKRYTASNEEAEEAIEAQLAMQDMTLDQFKQQLVAQGFSYEEQLEYMKEEMAIQNYLEDEIGEEALEVSDEESDEFYQMYQQEQTEDEEAPSFEELEPQIIALLQQQKQQEAVGVIIQQLRETAEIEYL